jgi:hypothetical protein
VPTTILIHPSPKYVSRHVRFVEFVFLFTPLSTRSSRPQSDSITIWFPPPLLILSSSLVPLLNLSFAVDAQQKTPSEISPTLVLADTAIQPLSQESAITTIP